MSESSAPPLLQVSKLCFHRHDELIFGPLDFTLHEGEVKRIEGDNGSGKSTLLRTLAGLLRPSNGTVFWQEAPISYTAIAHEIAFLGHQLGLKRDLSPLENLRIAIGLYGKREDITPLDALKNVGLYGFEHEPTKRLSAGQKKRTALARLLLVPATLWLLDEPFANLDKEGIERVNQAIDQHTQQEGAVLVTSHGAVTYLNNRSTCISLSP